MILPEIVSWIMTAQFFELIKVAKQQILGIGNFFAMKYKHLVTNVVFDNEKEAEDFGKKSMKRGFEHKIVEYNNENFERYWYK